MKKAWRLVIAHKVRKVQQEEEEVTWEIPVASLQLTLEKKPKNLQAKPKS
jgi:hypothetical protein